MKFKRGDRIMVTAEVTAVHEGEGYEIRIIGDHEDEFVDVAAGIEREAVKLGKGGETPPAHGTKN